MGHKHSKPGQKQKVVYNKKKIKKVRSSTSPSTDPVEHNSLSLPKNRSSNLHFLSLLLYMIVISYCAINFMLFIFVPIFLLSVFFHLVVSKTLAGMS